jgi:hypothetical protein
MPISFCFYPKHEYACPHVNHCPHLGGAALGILVHAADDHEQHVAMILGQLDFERGGKRGPMRLPNSSPSAACLTQRR